MDKQILERYIEIKGKEKIIKMLDCILINFDEDGVQDYAAMYVLTEIMGLINGNGHFVGNQIKKIHDDIEKFVLKNKDKI